MTIMTARRGPSVRDNAARDGVVVGLPGRRSAKPNLPDHPADGTALREAPAETFRGRGEERLPIETVCAIAAPSVLTRSAAARPTAGAWFALDSGRDNAIYDIVSRSYVTEGAAR